MKTILDSLLEVLQECKKGKVLEVALDPEKIGVGVIYETVKDSCDYLCKFRITDIRIQVSFRDYFDKEFGLAIDTFIWKRDEAYNQIREYLKNGSMFYKKQTEKKGGISI